MVGESGLVAGRIYQTDKVGRRIVSEGRLAAHGVAHADEPAGRVIHEASPSVLGLCDLHEVALGVVAVVGVIAPAVYEPGDVQQRISLVSRAAAVLVHGKDGGAAVVRVGLRSAVRVANAYQAVVLVVLKVGGPSQCIGGRDETQPPFVVDEGRDVALRVCGSRHIAEAIVTQRGLPPGRVGQGDQPTGGIVGVGDDGLQRGRDRCQPPLVVVGERPTLSLGTDGPHQIGLGIVLVMGHTAVGAADLDHVAVFVPVGLGDLTVLVLVGHRKPATEHGLLIVPQGIGYPLCEPVSTGVESAPAARAGGLHLHRISGHQLVACLVPAGVGHGSHPFPGGRPLVAEDGGPAFATDNHLGYAVVIIVRVLAHHTQQVNCADEIPLRIVAE